MGRHGTCPDKDRYPLCIMARFAGSAEQRDVREAVLCLRAFVVPIVSWCAWWPGGEKRRSEDMSRVLSVGDADGPDGNRDVFGDRLQRGSGGERLVGALAG